MWCQLLSPMLAQQTSWMLLTSGLSISHHRQITAAPHDMLLTFFCQITNTPHCAPNYNRVATHPESPFNSGNYKGLKFLGHDSSPWKSLESQLQSWKVPWIYLESYRKFCQTCALTVMLPASIHNTSLTSNIFPLLTYGAHLKTHLSHCHPKIHTVTYVISDTLVIHSLHCIALLVNFLTAYLNILCNMPV